MHELHRFQRNGGITRVGQVRVRGAGQTNCDRRCLGQQRSVALAHGGGVPAGPDRRLAALPRDHPGAVGSRRGDAGVGGGIGELRVHRHILVVG